MKKVNLKCKEVLGITLIPTRHHRLTLFDSAIEKEQFRNTHPDAEMLNLSAIEPLYIVVDLDNLFVLSDKADGAITYNEAFELIKHYL